MSIATEITSRNAQNCPSVQWLTDRRRPLPFPTSTFEQTIQRIELKIDIFPFRQCQGSGLTQHIKATTVGIRSSRRRDMMRVSMIASQKRQEREIREGIENSKDLRFCHPKLWTSQVFRSHLEVLGGERSRKHEIVSAEDHPDRLCKVAPLPYEIRRGALGGPSPPKRSICFDAECSPVVRPSERVSSWPPLSVKMLCEASY